MLSEKQRKYQRDFKRKKYQSMTPKARKTFLKNRYRYVKKYRNSKKGKETLSKYFREYLISMKARVIFHYSKGKNCCKCCGEKIPRFLTLDHIHGGGVKHRRKIKRKSLYSWLIARKFPKGYQILCFNCNSARGSWGICPHEEIKKYGDYAIKL